MCPNFGLSLLPHRANENWFGFVIINQSSGVSYQISRKLVQG